jgi:hypothetical protein
MRAFIFASPIFDDFVGLGFYTNREFGAVPTIPAIIVFLGPDIPKAHGNIILAR